MLILIAIMAYPQIKAAIWGNADLPPQYYEVPLNTRVNYGVMYLGLAAFLAIMSHDIHGTLEGTH